MDYRSDSDIKEGWAFPKICDILEVNYGKGLKKAKRMSGPIPVYGSNGAVGAHNVAFTQGPTIIIGRKGTVGAVSFSEVPCWPIDTTYFIDEFNDLDPKYIVYALKGLNLAELDTSTAIPGLNRNDLYGQRIPLAPLTEQKRIVAKVEELLARVNAARERLAKVKEILKRFRQSVLAAACSGRLTAEWRDHQIEIEPVSVLIKRLQQQHPEWAKAGVSDEEDLPDIPEHWEWTKVGQIGDITTGNTPPKKEAAYFGGSIHFFKPTDLDAGYYVENSIDSLSQQGAQLARVLTPLAVMVTCIGATIGKTGLARVEGATNQQINSVVTDEVFVSPHFLFWLITSPWVQEQIRLRASETTLPILNKGRFQRLPLPIPPLAEQHEIVQRVEALFKLADTIEKRVAVAAVRAEKLTQAILAKAFLGELVPTEAELARLEGRSYEPASVLLAKIKAQRKDVKPQQKHGRAPQRRNNISVLTS